ncbi:sterol O-acyltransferase 1 [Octodon degus]|uniref:O-acyltransferase n=1 Tax=Octodon degus TaxID=10160 RepID=A0A6P6DI87_OCTDE|nr:sterol O-acyltransferase 1 [Octodon degus]
MVGKEMSPRKRLSKASENLEKEDQRNSTEESLETFRNGQIDIKQLIAKKRQLAAEAEQLKPLFLKEVGSHFDDIVTSLIEKSASLDNGGCALTTFSILEEMKNNHRTKDIRAPPEQGKIFVSRRSLLDELFEVDHIRTIYHMFIAILIIFILSTLVVDYIDEGSIVFIFTLIRLIMKAHSFVRENVPRVLSAAKEKSSTVPIPTVSQYLYFLFAPTLIYRDSYPRTPTIRWRYVVMQFAQVFGCLFYVYYVFERLCAPLFGNIKQEPFSARVLVLCVFNSILPGVLMMFLSFFAFLHCWLNAFAEMLRFGDRMFYKDWWNSTSYSNYYRTWNVVVHDWLYYYAYKDLLWTVDAHLLNMTEDIEGLSSDGLCFENYVFPFLSVVAFNFIVNDTRKRPIWNILMWASLFLGQGVIVCFYSQEWYARQHCPLKNPTFLDYVRPRSWTCRYVF